MSKETKASGFWWRDRTGQPSSGIIEKDNSSRVDIAALKARKVVNFMLYIT